MLVGKPISAIRKILHQYPETSREESQTAESIAAFFAGLNDFTVFRNVGYHGLIAYRKFGEGKTVAFRAELDALPIFENSISDYKSENKGVSHVCGHDGHMSILMSLANDLNKEPPAHGTVCFLFQSAEETGEGAVAMIENPDFLKMDIDECYALHNIPGLDVGKVYCKTGSFSCASVGVHIEIMGKTAHAAHPEDAINPLDIAMEMWHQIGQLPEDEKVKDFALATSIGMHAGDRNFGTSPASAELLFTLRASLTADLEFMKQASDAIAIALGSKYGTDVKTSFHEYFPATENANLTEDLKLACSNAKVPFQEMTKPFRWSEDFAHFSHCFPILMFGLGSGRDQPALHAPNFDFPDELIEPGKSVFYELYKLRSPF